MRRLCFGAALRELGELACVDSGDCDIGRNAEIQHQFGGCEILYSACSFFETGQSDLVSIDTDSGQSVAETWSITQLEMTR